MLPLKLVIFIYSFILSTSLYADQGGHLLKEGALVHFAPPVINRDYYLIEFGYTIDKKIKSWNYAYNAYVTASIFEDWKDQPPHLRAGALGFKGGGVFPLLKWPVFYKVGIGYAKTVLHKNPLFGKDSQTNSKKDMLLAEIGVFYLRKQMLYGITYQKSNVKYFGRNLFFSIGVNY